MEQHSVPLARRVSRRGWLGWPALVVGLAGLSCVLTAEYVLPEPPSDAQIHIDRGGRIQVKGVSFNLDAIADRFRGVRPEDPHAWWRGVLTQSGRGAAIAGLALGILSLARRERAFLGVMAVAVAAIAVATGPLSGIALLLIMAALVALWHVPWARIGPPIASWLRRLYSRCS